MYTHIPCLYVYVYTYLMFICICIHISHVYMYMYMYMYTHISCLYVYLVYICYITGLSFVDAWIKFKHWIHSHSTTTHNGITTTRPVIIMAHNGKIYDFKIIHYNLKRILTRRYGIKTIEAQTLINWFSSLFSGADQVYDIRYCYLDSVPMMKDPTLWREASVSSATTINSSSRSNNNSSSNNSSGGGPLVDKKALTRTLSASSMIAAESPADGVTVLAESISTTSDYKSIDTNDDNNHNLILPIVDDEEDSIISQYARPALFNLTALHTHILGVDNIGAHNAISDVLSVEAILSHPYISPYWREAAQSRLFQHINLKN